MFPSSSSSGTCQFARACATAFNAALISSVRKKKEKKKEERVISTKKENHSFGDKAEECVRANQT
jgi:hypothetical protein